MFTSSAMPISPSRVVYKNMRNSTFPPSSYSNASFPILAGDIFTQYSSERSTDSSPSTDYILSPPLTSSPVHSHVPLPYLDAPSSPSPMPAFPTYGISGSLIVGETLDHSTSQQPTSGVDQLYLASTLPSKHHIYCTPTPTPTPSTRPALRATYSHNGVLSSSLGPGVSVGDNTTHWPRRTMTSDAIASSPATAHQTTPSHLRRSAYDEIPVPADPSAQGQQLRNEATAPPPFGASAPHTAPITHATEYTHPQPIAHPPYNEDGPAYPPAYHTQSHPSAHEPQYAQSWPPLDYPRPPFGYYPYGMANVKPEEPLLQPGELPAPRPPKSYAALIGEALLLAPPPHQLYVSEISDSVKKRYAYYRQNPSKIYNGVRHQTSMCKAFVKLPRPFGDQSGGARKWAIRKGCEGWFHGGGYYPPGSPPLAHTTIKRSSGGKAKATAQAKKLAIGTASSPEMEKRYEYSPRAQGGPSVGPAFDGTDQPRWYQSSPESHQFPTYIAQPPSASMRHSQATHPPPGFHYVPVNAAPNHPSGQSQMWVPAYNQHTQHHPGMYYPAPPGQGYTMPYTPPITQPAGSPQWPGYDNRPRAQDSENGSAGSYDGGKESPQSQPERGVTPPRE